MHPYIMLLVVFLYRNIGTLYAYIHYDITGNNILYIRNVMRRKL